MPHLYSPSKNALCINLRHAAWCAAATVGLTREIGIRMAIGAAPSQVLAAVVRQSLTSTGAGAAIGILVSAGVTRYLQSMLFDLTPLDPLVALRHDWQNWLGDRGARVSAHEWR